MQHDDFLTGCANTLEMSIKGQELLARDLTRSLRRQWRRWVRTVGSVTTRQAVPGSPARRIV